MSRFLARSALRPVVILALVGLMALAGTGDGPATRKAGGIATITAAGSDPVKFKINAVLDGLYPGAKLPVSMRLQNLTAVDLTVTSVWVESIRVRGGVVGCPPATYVRASPFSGSVFVPSKRQVVLDGFSISLLPTAPDACQGTSFKLRLKGQATAP
jgi:hypothetical protein